jgi:ABC-2 type transport system ATP-binding protein
MIKVANLTRRYPNGRGVFDLSFTVAQGEVFGFLGPNGAGKTTTIRHLMGFLRSKEGACTIGGLDCMCDRDKIQGRLGYIPGEINFFEDMTGYNFLEFLRKYRNDAFPNRRDELLERFDFSKKALKNTRLKKMSKGMKQKVAVVAAFMHDPEVLILDEPTSGLDPLMQNRFIELVLSEKARGKTILMSSHSFDEVERTANRVLIIRDGKTVALEKVDALKAKQMKRYEVTLSDSYEAARFKDACSKAGLDASSQDECHVQVTVMLNMSGFISVMNTHRVTNITAPALSLEEVFMQYYGGVS